MVLINLFIAFFVIVALGISWLVLNFVFGTEPQPATIGDKAATPATGMDAAKGTDAATKLVMVDERTTPRKKATCRDQVVAAAEAIIRENGVNEFAAKDVVEYLVKTGTDYSTSTIRTHVASRCCANATDSQGSAYSDFERVARGRYRLVEN